MGDVYAELEALDDQLGEDFELEDIASALDEAYQVAQDIADAGIGTVLRYLKNLTGEEVGALHDAGLKVGLIYETTAKRALLGAAAGIEDGVLALQQAQALGAPPNAAIYATVDDDAGTGSEGPSQLSAIGAYGVAFGGCLPGKARFGLYGSGLVQETVRGVELRWLAGAMGWQGSRAFLAAGRPALVQGPTLDAGGLWAPPGFSKIHWADLGFSYDPDVLLVDDIGAW